MPSVQYYNRTAPFWDFVANLEEQGTSHPFFNRCAEPTEPDHERPNPWTEGWTGFPWGPFPHRGRHAHHHPPPPPPPAGDDEHTPDESGPSDGEQPDKPEHDGPGPHPGPHGPGHHHHHAHGRHGPHGRGGPHSRSGPFRGRGRGGCGFGGFGRERRGGPPFHPYAGFGPFGAIAEMFGEQVFGSGEKSGAVTGEDFKPEADVFDTPDAFVVHVSLPGAKKEDVGVNWDAERSELAIAGVVYRPGDEEFLKTLALDERRVGAFERKIRLGSRANPASVDVDGITAKMEDGVLRIEVPKLDSGYVEIKKVDIE